MCGIVFAYGLKISYQIQQKMVKSLIHRGPDSYGTFQTNLGYKHLFMGHTRLAIQDLSELGAQPFKSECGKHIIIFNGEIYNFHELKSKLTNTIGTPKRFVSNSDTEILLNMLISFGVDETLALCNGMFAFIYVNLETNQATLARDRVGIKPLYYKLTGELLLAGSEIKSLIPHPMFNKELNVESIYNFLRLQYIPSNESIFTGLKKLSPGHYLTVNLDRPNLKDNSKLVRYWSLDYTMLDENESFDDQCKELDNLLRNAVELRLLADVKVGTFLSGGIDSSLVTSIAQSLSNTPINSFTVGFEDNEYDESVNARVIAEYLGTNHNEELLSEERCLELIPQLPHIWDEPFGDSSQIPTTLICAFARKKLKVCLSGDGGDELFFGYQRYQLIKQFDSLKNYFPEKLRNFLSGIILKDLKHLNIIPNLINTYSQLTNRSKFNNTNEVLRCVAEDLPKNQSPHTYSHLISHFKQKNHIINFSPRNDYLYKALNQHQNDLGLHYYSTFDFNSYLPDDILVKLDRSSMANSLECRVPLLDHRVVEYAYQSARKYSALVQPPKTHLREVLSNYLPRKLYEDRPKSGFSIPLQKWLRVGLKDWAEELIHSSLYRQSPLFNFNKIEQIWKLHQTGDKDYGYYLWDLIMLAQWHRFYFD